MSKNVRVKQQKMLLVLPLLVIPFITMAFWALGGGSGKKQIAETKGLNLDLPNANLKNEKAIDKLGFYDQATKDSMKLEEWMRNDPYFNADTTPFITNELEDFTTNTKYGQRLNTSLYEKVKGDPGDEVLKRLERLKMEMEKPVAVKEEDYTIFQPTSNTNMNPPSGLEAGDGEEILQLQNTLDKILDIQHPDRVKERSVKHKGAVYAVRNEKGADTLVKGFYSYSDEKELEPAEQSAIEAIIAANQTIVNGAVVKFRLLTDIYIKGHFIPKNILISGIALLDGERLTVEINSIRHGKSIFSVKMEVYDMDGLPGIHIPGTINREVAKESLNNSLSLADMNSLDPSLKAGAIQTGVGALKSLISKKAKLVRVQLKAGYKVLLNNKNQNQ